MYTCTHSKRIQTITQVQEPVGNSGSTYAIGKLCRSSRNSWYGTATPWLNHNLSWWPSVFHPPNPSSRHSPSAAPNQSRCHLIPTGAAWNISCTLYTTAALPQGGLKHGEGRAASAAWMELFPSPLFVKPTKNLLIYKLGRRPFKDLLEDSLALLAWSSWLSLVEIPWSSGPVQLLLLTLKPSSSAHGGRRPRSPNQQTIGAG